LRSRGNARSDAKASQPYLTGCPIHQDVGRLDILWTRPARVGGPARSMTPGRAAGIFRPPLAGRPGAGAARRPENRVTSMVCWRARTSSSGRSAHAASSWSFSSYSCLRRCRLAAVGCSTAGSTASTQWREPSRHVLPKDTFTVLHNGSRGCYTHHRQTKWTAHFVEFPPPGSTTVGAGSCDTYTDVHEYPCRAQFVAAPNARIPAEKTHRRA